MLRSLTASAFLAAAVAALPAVSAAKSVNISELHAREAVDLLRDFDETAADAANAAAELDSQVRTLKLSWQSNAYQLEALRDDVNDMGRMLVRLEDLHEVLAPADREALSNLAPLLKQMAADTQAAVLSMNADQRNLWRPAFRDPVGRLSAETRQLVNALGKHHTE